MEKNIKSNAINELINVLTANLTPAEIKTAMVTSEISTKITEERINRNMTQKEFATYMGVSQAMVSKWESGDYNFTISSIANICAKLELDFNFTITSDEDWKEVQQPKNNIVFSFNSYTSLQNEIDNFCVSA